MSQGRIEEGPSRLIAELKRLWMDERDRSVIEKAIQALNVRYVLKQKISKEPGVDAIIRQMVARLANSYPRLSDLENKKILDIACGSNTSRLPATFHLSTPIGEMSLGHSSKGYTALFEPWFCRILLELGASPLGIDFGDLEQEAFPHYRVDLGKPGALDFLPDASFDGIQDSRLFGSPEFTAQFPNQTDRIKIAREISRQEQRLLKIDGIIIHSDAAVMLR